MFTGDPGRFDWTLFTGDTAQPLVLVLENVDDDVITPFDLTGVTGECQVRAAPGGELVLEPEVSLVDAEAGEVTFMAPPEETAAVLPGTYAYALRLTWPDGSIRTVLEGKVTVRASVVG